MALVVIASCSGHRWLLGVGRRLRRAASRGPGPLLMALFVAACHAGPGPEPPSAVGVGQGAGGALAPPTRPPSTSGFELVPQDGHTAEAVSVAFSPDGELVATGGFDQSLRLWDREGVARASFHCADEKVHAVRFSPKGDLVAGACGGRVVVWGLERGERRASFGENVIDFAWSGDGSRVATVGRIDEATRAALLDIWRVESGSRERSAAAPGERQLLSVDWSADGHGLATASLDRRVQRWDVATLSPTSAGAGAGPAPHGARVAFGPKGQRLAVGGATGIVVVDLVSGASTDLGPGGDFAWRADGGALAVALDGGRIELRDSRTGTVLGGARQRAGVERLALAPDGAVVAVVGVDDPAVRLLATDGGAELHALGAGTRRREQVVFRPDGSLLAVTGEQIELWDPRTGALVRTLDAAGRRVGGTAFSPDGALLVASVGRTQAAVWDVATGARVVTIAIDNRDDMGWHFAWAPAPGSAEPGPLLLAAAGSKLVRWRPGGAPREVPLASVPWISALVFSPDAATLAVGAQRELVLVDVAAGFQERARIALDSWGWSFEPAWSADGRLVATAAGPVLELWNAADGQLFGRAGDRSMFAPVFFSPGGRWLVFAGREDTVELWPPTALAGATPPARLGTGAAMMPAPPGATSFPFAGGARSLAPSADGRFVAAGSDEGEVALFDVQAERRAWSDARHGARIWSLAWDRAGQVLASASGVVRLQRVSDGEALTLHTVALPGRRVGAYVSGDAGAVAGDPDALATLRYRTEPGALRAELAAFDDVAVHVSRPDLVDAFLSGASLAPL